MAGQPLDQVDDAGAAEAPQRRPGREPARRGGTARASAPAGRRSPGSGSRRASPSTTPARRRRGRSPGRSRRARSASCARRSPTSRRRRRHAPSSRHRGETARPQPEGAVDVHPRAVLVRERRRTPRTGRRRRSGCCPPGAPRSSGPSADASASRERVGADPPLLVHRYDVRVAEAEEPQRQVDRRVPLRPDQRPAPRGPPASPDCTSYPASTQDGVARRGQAGEVGHRRAGHEADRRSGREPEQVEQPAPGHLLDRGPGRGERRGARRSGPTPRSASRRPARPAATPPITIPKNRPDGIATSPGSHASASRSTTSAAGVGPSGSSPRRRTISSASI